MDCAADRLPRGRRSPRSPAGWVSRRCQHSRALIVAWTGGGWRGRVWVEEGWLWPLFVVVVFMSCGQGPPRPAAGPSETVLEEEANATWPPPAGF